VVWVDLNCAGLHLPAGACVCHRRRQLPWSGSTWTALGFICRQAQASATGAGNYRGLGRLGLR